MAVAFPAKLTLESTVVLRPLSTQIENGIVIIGHSDQFLELPLEGLDLIAGINRGHSLAQVRVQFEAQHDSLSAENLLEILDEFQSCDFIAAIDGQPIPEQHPRPVTTSSRFPHRWARALCSTPVLVGWLIVVVPAMLWWLITPALWPHSKDFFWSPYTFIVVLTNILCWLICMALHEGAHWIAARAKGIDATVTWTQRLGIMPMSQTVMHNIWAVPRTARLLPLAAGMALDALMIAAPIYLLGLQQLGLLTLSAVFAGWLRAFLLTGLLAFLAQFWVFSKMDGYYLLSALFGQRNLQADTYAWLRARLLHRGEFEPPAQGMRFIYGYAILTIIGGGLFFGELILYSIPIGWHMFWEAMRNVMQVPSQLARIDGIATLTGQSIVLGLLLYIYIREGLARRMQLDNKPT